MKKYLIVSGFGWSGGGAVVDMLRDHSYVAVFDREFRIFEDPYGIFDLRYELVENWNLIRSSSAITDFLWFCKKCNTLENLGFLSPFGLDYKKYYTSDFMEMAYSFIDSITEFKYNGSNIHVKMKKSYFQYKFSRAINKFYRVVLKKHGYENNELYFSKPSAERFDNSVKNFIENIFKGVDKDIIILDGAIEPTSQDYVKLFFDDPKMIVVDRDPRDNYIDLLQNYGLIGAELEKKDGGKKFVSWFLQTRPQKYNDNVLYLRFEDVVNNPVETENIISSFVGYDLGKWTPQYFNPDVSRRNIRMWKRPEFKQYGEQIEYIKDALKLDDD